MRDWRSRVGVAYRRERQDGEKEEKKKQVFDTRTCRPSRNPAADWKRTRTTTTEPIYERTRRRLLFVAGQRLCHLSSTFARLDDGSQVVASGTRKTQRTVTVAGNALPWATTDVL